VNVKSLHDTSHYADNIRDFNGTYFAENYFATRRPVMKPSHTLVGCLSLALLSACSSHFKLSEDINQQNLDAAQFAIFGVGEFTVDFDGNGNLDKTIFEQIYVASDHPDLCEEANNFPDFVAALLAGDIEGTFIITKLTGTITEGEQLTEDNTDHILFVVVVVSDSSGVRFLGVDGEDSRFTMRNINDDTEERTASIHATLTAENTNPQATKLRGTFQQAKRCRAINEAISTDGF
jgi:hypothetical protein